MDTGASHTCISSKIIGDLRLWPIGKVPVAGVHGSRPVNNYQFGVGFLFEPGLGQFASAPDNWGWFLIDGTEFANEACAFDVLLGRDVICHGALHVSPDGHFTFCV